jgi:hypothetical protein
VTDDDGSKSWEDKQFVESGEDGTSKSSTIRSSSSTSSVLSKTDMSKFCEIANCR